MKVIDDTALLSCAKVAAKESWDSVAALKRPPSHWIWALIAENLGSMGLNSG